MIDDFHNIRSITILGVGLIGGSLGLALKANGFQGQIIGLGRRMETLELGLECGAVDRITTNFQTGIADTSLAVICTPVDLIPQMAQRIQEVQRQGSQPLVVTDAGSVKQWVVESVENQFERASARELYFVGSHPMAGSEQAGIAAARANLYHDAKCILTPTERTHPQAKKLVTDLWTCTGARVYYLSPTEHDMLIAGASHLPHLVASVLTSTVGGVRCETASALDFAATGFRDTTRIAAGAPELWTGIFTQNAHSLIPLIDTFIQHLTAFKSMLENHDAAQIEQFLNHAKHLRDTWKYEK